MQHLDDIFRDTQSLVQPHPVEPFEREAAGWDDEPPLAFSAWTWNELLTCVAFTLIFWAAGFEAVKCLVPYLIWWFE